MYDKRLASEIKLLFERYPVARLQLKEVISILGLSKRERRDIKDTLRSLVVDEILLKEGTFYISNRKKKTKKKEKRNSDKRTNAKLIEAVFDATSLAKGYSFAFANTSENDYFIAAEDTLSAYHGDKILIEPYKKRGNRLYGVVKEVVERKNVNLIGNLSKFASDYLFVCDNHKFHNSVRIQSNDVDLDKKKVEIEVTSWGNSKKGILPRGKVISVIGEANDPEIEVLGVIKQYGLPLDFSEEVKKESEDVNEIINQNEISGRKDFRDLITVTIDPITAKDFDDAISVVKDEENYLVYVHIADVGHYVRPGSEIYKEAVNRGNSFYFPKRVIPMLPEKLCNKVCSLRPDEDKLTLTVLTKFDSAYNIIHQEAYESIIRSNARLNYEEVDDYFEKNKIDCSDEVKEMLNISRSLSSALSQKAIERGYINFRLPDIDYIYDDDGNLVNIIESEETASHKLVENFMLLANEYVATFLKHKTKKTIFRIHEAPDIDRIEKVAKLLRYYGFPFSFDGTMNYSIQSALKALENKVEEKVFNKMILRAMKKAQYSVKHNIHFGLSIENYTHFTSPIRRLSDLIIHLQLKEELGNDGYNFKGDDLKKLAEAATGRESLSDEAYRTIMQKMIIYYMKEKVGEEFNAFISSMNKNNIFVTLDKYPITGVVRMSSIKGDYIQYDEEHMIAYGRKNKNSKYILGQKVKILVTSVTDDIYFSFID